MKQINIPSPLLLTLTFPVLLLILLLMPFHTVRANEDSLPQIDIWNGLNQTFGQLGAPQEWVNVLGTVSDSDDAVTSLYYSLNNGVTKTLSIGPDEYRLAQPGDFNIEIPYASLQAGANNVMVMAIDALGNQISTTVVLNSISGNNWPLPFSIDWSAVGNIADVAQIVDGKWAIGADGLRPTQLDYDRAVAIGDQTTWTNYEVMVPIKVHGIDPAAPFGPPSGNPGVGFLVRWQGHTQKNNTQQPGRGWERHGALGWYRFFKRDDDSFGGRLMMVRNVTETVESGLDKKISFDIPYNFKLRSVSVPGDGSYYHMKVWQADQPEPFAWDLISRGDGNSTDRGSVLLLAHHVDVSFGNMTVTPVTNIQPTLALNKNGSGNIQIQPDPAQFPSGVPYGTMVNVTATADVGSLFTGWEGDLAGQSSVVSFSLTKDFNATALFKQDTSGIQSDDFNACSLDTGKWTFVNPLNDGVLGFTGKQATISVPTDVEHNVWRDGNNAPRLMQAANNADLDLEVKFDSALTEKFQIHGLVVEQDAQNFVRFDFNSDGTQTRILAIAFANGEPVSGLNFTSGVLDNGATPTYMRVSRSGDQWMQSYSTDGSTWKNSFSFAFPLQVSTVGGFFTGNVGSGQDPAPAYTGFMDYFFNRAALINPEDGVTHTVQVTTTGTGTGNVVVSQPSDTSFGGYKCGETVTLTAQPTEGSSFIDWVGDDGASGSNLTTTVTITGGVQNVVAAFTDEAPTPTTKIFLPIVMK